MGSGEEKNHYRSASKEKKLLRESSGAISRRATIYLQKGDALKATEYFKRAAETAKKEGDACTMISCYLNAGACLVSKGQIKDGKGFLFTALRLAKTEQPDTAAPPTADNQASMIEIMADIYYNLAVVAQKENDSKKAISFFKISTEFYLKMDCLLHAAESLVSLAECYRHSKEVEEEMSSLQSAQELFHRLEDHYNEAETRLGLARACFREGKTEQAKEMLSTAKLLCLRVDDHSLQGIHILKTGQYPCNREFMYAGKLYSQFGLVYTSMGLFDMGIHNFERALPLIRERTRSDDLLQAEASLLQNIGAAYNEMALFSDAVVYHKEAAAIHGEIISMLFIILAHSREIL